jgi:hypothetical protein
MKRMVCNANWQADPIQVSKDDDRNWEIVSREDIAQMMSEAH